MTWDVPKATVWISVKCRLMDILRGLLWVLLRMKLFSFPSRMMEFLFMASGWRGFNGETVFAYDMECRAVHVPVSPYRHYLDVNGFYKAIRITKM